MEFEGLVIKVLPQAKGVSARGEWVKQEVVFEQPGEFGRKVCVSFWGDKALDAAGLKEGDVVSIAANVESREHNGRWYTEVRAWRISKVGQAKSPAPAMTQNQESAPMPSASDDYSYKDEVDDLPF